MSNRTKTAFVIILAIVAILGTGFIMGQSAQQRLDRTNPVCHSITEDSVISDCDYRNGAWYRK